MQEAPKLLPRLNAASVFIALGAFVVFGTVDGTVTFAKPQTIEAASGSNDSTESVSADSQEAYAVPRNAPDSTVEIIFPRPLPPSVVAEYKQIMSMQQKGNFVGADKLLERLDDKTLVASVLADRYLRNNYHASSLELLNWYKKYYYQPVAASIYKLLVKRLPRSKLPPVPQISLLPDVSSNNIADNRPAFRPDNIQWHAAFSNGLSAWQRGDIADAKLFFMNAASNIAASDDNRAAGAFWAARAALRLELPNDYLNLLRRAARFNDTFYGMIAGRLLGEGFGVTGIAATLTEADITAVDAKPEGHLAFALLQIGASAQASLALRSLWPSIERDPSLAHAVMVVAARAGLVDVAIAISAQQRFSQGNDIAGVNLPLPTLHPADGFIIDPSLMYALVRTESGFEPDIVSPAGARGLMQLMPVTASYIARSQGLTDDLSDPSTNLALGQGYIRFLAHQPTIHNNLLAILASYNAGQGAAAAWFKVSQDASDPLMELEMIPINQTRHFVEQVLLDSWIYAKEIGMRPIGLDDLAEGNLPQMSQVTVGFQALNQ